MRKFSNVYCLSFLIFSGATSAKLVAHKSKGMPLISIPLSRLTNSSADDAKANLSFELFKAYKGKHNDVVRGCNILYLNAFTLLLCILVKKAVVSCVGYKGIAA